MDFSDVHIYTNIAFLLIFFDHLVLVLERELEDMLKFSSFSQVAPIPVESTRLFNLCV